MFTKYFCRNIKNVDKWKTQNWRSAVGGHGNKVPDEWSKIEEFKEIIEMTFDFTPRGNEHIFAKTMARSARDLA
jgi:hypothetical protein